MLNVKKCGVVLGAMISSIVVSESVFALTMSWSNPGAICQQTASGSNKITHTTLAVRL